MPQKTHVVSGTLQLQDAENSKGMPDMHSTALLPAGIAMLY